MLRLVLTTKHHHQKILPIELNLVASVRGGMGGNSNMYQWRGGRVALFFLRHMHCLSSVNFSSHSFEKCFSNSLIIHQVKTKEITTVKEVWIPGLN